MRSHQEPPPKDGADMAATPFSAAASPFTMQQPPKPRSLRVDSEGRPLRLQTAPDALSRTRGPFPQTAHPDGATRDFNVDGPLSPQAKSSEPGKVTNNAADMHARILALQRSRSKRSKPEDTTRSPESPQSPPQSASLTSGLDFGRSNSFRTRQRSSLSARRGLVLDDQKDDKMNLNLNLSQLSVKEEKEQPKSARKPPPRKGLFSDYRKYIDIETGTLNFAGKACVHAQGIEFSSGEKFSISLDKLQFISELGVGNYGTVQKVLHTPNSVFMAVKEIRLELDESAFRQIIMELDVLHRCEMPNIIAFYGAFFVEGAVYICMEYMDGGSVNQIYKGGIPEKYLKYIVKHVVGGLRQLKEQFNIIHRDVKPTNVLCSTTGDVKLCDFGVSGNLVASIAVTNIGCQSYMAPERIRATGANGANGANGIGPAAYTVESDIWSLGLSIVEMATGEYPYDAEAYGSIFSQLNAIVEDPAPKLDPKLYSPAACDFVARMLNKSPMKRPRYSQIADHPWLQTPACTKEEMGEFVRQRLAAKVESDVTARLERMESVEPIS
ncbi:mitogen-activated protein kinase kinase [Starmerella bacillaris]|uniref:mitogen-activated protein kinase kinase n=1 Tax=Starmerella bacillaris TaxID=1247836 RepID=A0AAV5RN98_STABA|nr:mitogen-activated protein kinase kinase [Starmerella bacillaris]